MNAPRTGSGGLSQAQRRVADLVIDLDWTLDSAKKLSDAGEHEAALRVVQEQRDALIALADDIAIHVAGVGVPARTPRMVARAYRRVVALAAALTIAVCTLAAAVAAVRDDGGFGRATADLENARSIQDPAARLSALTKIVDATRGLPADPRTRALNARLGDALDGTGDDLERTSHDSTMAGEARKLADQVRAGETPSGPPQSIGQSPVETIRDELNRR